MITPSFSLTSTERVLPKLALDFTTASLDPRVTFTRSGNTATVTNSSGVIAGVDANLPRFDFDPITLACKGLLIEESRTNAILYSSAYNTGVANMWGANSITFTTGQLAPDGANTALQCRQDNNTSAVISSGILNEPTITSGATITYTQYFKYTNSRWLVLQLGPPSGSASASRLRGWFDLQNGVVGSVSNVSPATGCTISIEPAPNGYYRCTVTGALNDSLVKARPTWWMADGDGSLNRASTNSSYIAWGSQWENATFATSYIPTTTSALTRNADVATMTGTNFSDWFNSGAGGVVARVLPSTVFGARPILQFDDNTVNEIIALRGNTTNPELIIVDGGASQAQIDAGTIAANTIYNLGAAWATNNCAAAANGGVLVTDTTATIPTVTQARLGSDGANYLNGQLQTIRYWPQRIVNAEVQAFSK